MNNIDRACPNCGSLMFRNGKCFNCGYVKEESTIRSEDNQPGSINPAVPESNNACPQCGSLMFRNGRCYNCGFVAGNDIITQMTPTQNTQSVYPPNLAPCPDCKHLVSLYATSCPNCGRPLKPLKEMTDIDDNEPIQRQPEKSGSGCGTFVAVVFGILVAVWILTKILRIEITGTIIPIK